MVDQNRIDLIVRHTCSPDGVSVTYRDDTDLPMLLQTKDGEVDDLITDEELSEIVDGMVEYASSHGLRQVKGLYH